MDVECFGFMADTNMKLRRQLKEVGYKSATIDRIIEYYTK